jgi:hypothetical protein
MQTCWQPPPNIIALVVEECSRAPFIEMPIILPFFVSQFVPYNVKNLISDVYNVKNLSRLVLLNKFVQNVEFGEGMPDFVRVVGPIRYELGKMKQSFRHPKRNPRTYETGKNKRIAFARAVVLVASNRSSSKNMFQLIGSFVRALATRAAASHSRKPVSTVVRRKPSIRKPKKRVPSVRSHHSKKPKSK